MRRSLGTLVLTAAVLVAASSCGSSDACSCAVENAGERRAILCGESACVAGATFSCTKAGEAVRGGACVAARPSMPDAGSGVVTPAPPVDTSCSDLATFCTTSCAAPASVAADCVATASSGNASACASWTSSNQVLCHP